MFSPYLSDWQLLGWELKRTLIHVRRTLNLSPTKRPMVESVAGVAVDLPVDPVMTVAAHPLVPAAVALVVDTPAAAVLGMTAALAMMAMMAMMTGAVLAGRRITPRDTPEHLVNGQKKKMPRCVKLSRNLVAETGRLLLIEWPKSQAGVVAVCSVIINGSTC